MAHKDLTIKSVGICEEDLEVVITDGRVIFKIFDGGQVTVKDTSEVRRLIEGLTVWANWREFVMEEEE